MATAQTARASDGYSAALAVAGFIAHVLEFFGKKQRRRTMCISVLIVVLFMQLECKFSGFPYRACAYIWSTQYIQSI